MNQLKVFQIGLGSFGRYGFEKLVEMEKHLETVDVSLEGVCDIDRDRLEKAEKFAAANDIEFKTFHRATEMYEYASQFENVMIYDASPSETHARHLYDSLAKGFFHLAEKPPSMTREQHIKEKKLAEQQDVMWKTDFIERENPVVKKARQIISGEEIDRIEVFRESSIGVQKLLEPVERAGVKGGDVLDKMVHEVYVQDFIEDSGGEPGLELESVESNFFMPKGFDSDNFMGIRGEPKKEIDEETATGQTFAKFSADETEIHLNSSWLGVSEKARIRAREMKEVTGAELLDEEYRSSGESAFLFEEARFFIIEGSRNLLGDMLHKKIYDLETGEELENPDLMHDQLYRVIEKAVNVAAGVEDAEVTEKETDVMMNALYDTLEKAVEGAEGYYEELDRAREKLKNLRVDNLDATEVDKAGLAG